MPRQYVQVAFRSGGTRYTYLNDQPVDVKPGDLVEVESRHGPMELEALDVFDEPPPDVPSHVQYKHCIKV